MNIPDFPVHLLVTGGVLAALVIGFVLFFWIPGLWHWYRLRKIQSGLKKLDASSSPDEFRKVFATDKRLAHLWKEYQDSLHKQYEERDGQEVVVSVRSTTPAEAWFSSQFVVDSRLRTEFFKHLPGIFTGVGIIGTFTGLIEGLHQFKVSEDALAVRSSLEALMSAVGDAFMVSAGAILAAMVVTFLEKLLLASLYRHAEEIAHTVDARFEAGAGEEYLSRLVRASEDSASQAKILKDSLVRDLGDLLRELTAAQIANSEKMNQHLAQRIERATQLQATAARESNKAAAEVIAGNIKDSLKDPLDQIASSVKLASGDQSASAVRMLNDVMVSFSQRLNDLFGGQISGINELNRQSAQAMQDAVRSLNSLVADMKESGRQSTDDMATKMAAAISAMEERQISINAQTQGFVEQIKKLVDSSQTETQGKLQETIGALGQQMQTILATLGDSQRRVLEENRARESSMSDRNKLLMDSMRGSVEQAVKEISAASQTMAQSVSALSSATTTTIERLNVGAERINNAVTNFATAGDRVNRALELAAGVGNQLTETSGALTSGGAALQDALRDYRSQREFLGALLGEVRTTIETAKRDASVSADLVQRIEQAAGRLGEAHKSADEYMNGVSDVLARSSEAFADSVTNTLGRVNHEFHEKLSSAVGLLSSAIQELEVSLAGVGSKR